MFGNLEKTMKEGRERWEKIEKNAASLKKSMDEGQRAMPEEVAELLFLVIDHLRPMNPDQKDLDEVTGGLAELLGALGRNK